MIQFEKEVITFLGLPSIPKKEWDGKQSFAKGIAVVQLADEREAYAICAFDAECDKEPRIVKVFGIEPFVNIKKVFVVPSYMTTQEEVKEMDLDEASTKKAESLLKEAAEIENDGVGEKIETPENEYYFDHIKNDEQAKAFIQAYNSRNRIKGRIPTTHDGLVMRLAVIYSDTQKKTK